MQRSEFIDEVFDFFRCDNSSLKKAYDLAFTVKESINWDKLYQIVIDEAESRYLPPPKWFKEKFFRCRIQNIQHYYENEGKIVEITFSDGYKYDFELYNCRKSQLEIKEAIKRKYNNGAKGLKVVNIAFFTDRYEQLKFSRRGEYGDTKGDSFGCA